MWPLNSSTLNDADNLKIEQNIYKLEKYSMLVEENEKSTLTKSALFADINLN